MDRAPVLALYGVALAGGFATAFDNPTRRAFVVEMVPEDHVQNAVSLNSALMTGSRVVGPALAGVLSSSRLWEPAWSVSVDTRIVVAAAPAHASTSVDDDAADVTWPAGLARVKQARGFVTHQTGGFHVDVRFGNRKLNALVFSNRTIKYDAIVSITSGTINKPIGITNTLCCNQYALSIQAI